MVVVVVKGAGGVTGEIAKVLLHTVLCSSGAAAHYCHHAC